MLVFRRVCAFEDMLSGVRMRFILVVGLTSCLFVAINAKSAKKSGKDEAAILNKKLLNKAKPPPAIIAIEIVDPNENKTSKNSKRTIDSSLGYGYNSVAPAPPKYQVYKYSQHDIPPYRYNQYDIQKSISYNIPTHGGRYQPSGLSQYYQPGTTLFSTVNNQGHASGLTAQAPQQSYGGHEPQVPVIILRVFPSQLNDPSAVLHPNLPQSHPLASTINSIDIQSLLSKYVQNYLVGQQQEDYHYQEPQQQYQYIQPQQAQYQNSYHHHQDDGLLTHENYPKDTHTRVIFRTDKNQAGISPYSSESQTKTKTIQVELPPNHSFSSVQVETPDMQYGYMNQDDGGSQSYYYNNQPNSEQNYYYNQPEYNYQQQSGAYEQQGDVSEETPHNYHAHQKRSKINVAKSPPEGLHKDISRLEPIKA